ncbi:hypothetical protein [Demequina flava]|uniref:hypothetical protein n=1 Tax=Demequina flava TaxID=1095025 RepID=UPI0007808CB1|nr:hypothetical protein [Demequina flava]
MALTHLLDRLEAIPESFTLAQLMAHASRGGIEAAVKRGDIARILPNRYAARLHADSWRTRSHAAARWGPAGCAVTGTGALFDAGVLPEPPETVHVLVPHWRHRPTPWWLRVTSSTYRPPVIQERPDGTPEVDPALALIHAYGYAPERGRAELFYSLARTNRIDAHAVRQHLERMPRVRGRASLLKRCDWAADGVESFLEEQGGARVLVGAEFEGVVRQHRVRIMGDLYRLDAYDPATRTAFEFDGAAFHDRAPQRMKDIRRDAALATVGIMTVRFGYADVMQRPEWCRDVALGTMGMRRKWASVAS